MKIMRIGSGSVLVAVLVLLMSCGGDKKIVSPLVPQVLVTVSPSTIIIDQGATHQFTATVTGTANTAVVWSIAEGGAGGKIGADGTYTAPAAAGTFHVVATSAADSSKTATAAVTVNSVAVTVSPSSGDLEPGTSYQFVATVTGSVNRNVTWRVQEGATGGSITAEGLYTAPATTGTFHVIVTSAADSTRTSTVPVTVATLAVSINPRAVGLLPSGTRAFTASVAGSMDDRVNWVVQEGSSGGGITSAGLYTAPATMGEYHIVATSVAHPSVSAIAKVIVSDSGFTSTGDMTQWRSEHTATLLPNGDVLLVGGYENGKTAELFDSKAGTFRATGEMKAARAGHTATLLPSGKVLITGGGYLDWVENWFVLDSAELYDPATGQFAPAGTMLAARAFHSAILLSNGKVLIVGGEAEFSAELYDPATGAFTPTASMSSECSGEVATALADKRVLVTGGGSAEIFDPATASFARVGSFARSSHTATLLDDGRVLLAGGYRFAQGSFTFYDDAQTLDPSTSQFSSLATMNEYRSQHTATRLPNGQILLVGGWANGSIYSTAELFDPSTSAFLVTGAMAEPRAGHSATLLPDGRVLVAGGSSDKSAEIYTPLP